MRFKIFLIVICFITCNHNFGQDLEPLDIAMKLFSKEEFKEIEKYSTGEFKGHPNGQDLSDNIKLNFRLLSQDTDMAVINITITDSLNKGLDSYLHFKKESNWKITAFRALAMTGFLAKAREEIIEEKNKNGLQNLLESGAIKSEEDFEYTLSNIDLILSLDDDIIQHFYNNKAEFEILKDHLIADGYMNEERYKGKKFEKEYKKLLLSGIDKDYIFPNNCIMMSIGGMLDNTVGYMYISDKKGLPKMSPNYIIMLREIGDGWYLYKTT